jgi:hypothetical protein
MVAGKKISKGHAPCVIGDLRCHNITLLQDCDISGAGGRPVEPGEGRNYPEATAMGMRLRDKNLQLYVDLMNYSESCIVLSKERGCEAKANWNRRGRWKPIAAEAPQNLGHAGQTDAARRSGEPIRITLVRL